MRQDPVVGGRHMGVGADDEAGAAVDEMAERLLLAGRLGMDVDDDGIGGLAERAGVELALERREGIVERVHEDAAHHLDDEEARAACGLDQRRRRAPACPWDSWPGASGAARAR